LPYSNRTGTSATAHASRRRCSTCPGQRLRGAEELIEHAAVDRESAQGLALLPVQAVRVWRRHLAGASAVTGGALRAGTSGRAGRAAASLLAGWSAGTGRPGWAPVVCVARWVVCRWRANSRCRWPHPIPGRRPGRRSRFSYVADSLRGVTGSAVALGAAWSGRSRLAGGSRRAGRARRPADTRWAGGPDSPLGPSRPTPAIASTVRIAATSHPERAINLSRPGLGSLILVHQEQTQAGGGHLDILAAEGTPATASRCSWGRSTHLTASGSSTTGRGAAGAFPARPTWPFSWPRARPGATRSPWKSRPPSPPARRRAAAVAGGERGRPGARVGHPQRQRRR
jgi:hypothetical protein